jgi:hypothetical protein
MKTKKLTIFGELEKPVAGSGTENMQHESTYFISGSNRDLTEAHTFDFGAKQVAEFVFEDGSSWLCDNASLHELFPEASNAGRADDAFVVPATLKNPVNDRGLIGDLALKLVKVFTKKTVSIAIKDLADKLEAKQLTQNGKIKEGLFRLHPDFALVPFDQKTSAKPFLLFIHGTNSSTWGAYADLMNSDVWNFIQATYAENILGFQHKTLTESPLQNAVNLVKQLPNNAELHIISHSRGGLIGDILCRYSKNKEGRAAGFSKTNIELLKKETGRENDIENIKELNNIFLTKEISVKKFIRVACPAAGTKLASKRLEHVFNTFFNLMGGDLNPLADTFRSIISEAVKTKDNLKALPGVESMNPDSPFIKILNDKTPADAINDVSLAVIAGNSKANLSLKGLATILLRLFFFQRNDLVVNTDSMYLGCNRKNQIQYFFAEGTEIDHVHYFSNSKTREALSLALKTPDGERIPGYTTTLQAEVPGSDRGLDRGLEGGQLFSPAPSGKKPIVVLLPGIMGSNLSRKGDRIWINYWEFLTGGLTDLEDLADKSITATSLVSTSYKKLANKLSFTYDVVVYPFDWRRQLSDCASELNEKVKELMKLKQPIKIIGHSMGGVLMRDFIIKHNDTWLELNATKGLQTGLSWFSPWRFFQDTCCTFR